MADRKEQLKSMLQNFIQDKPEAAQLDFHEYVSAKLGEISSYKAPVSEPASTEEDEED